MIEPFWTEEKLKELARLYPKSSQKILIKKFRKPIEKIHDAYEFYIQHTKFMVKSELENGIKITYYAAYDAHNIRENMYLPALEYDE